MKAVWNALLVLVIFSPAIAETKTFCNPLDLDYGWRGSTRSSRHGADPVIVLYHNRYYLFSTWDRPGYRVSDDLIDWKFIPFADPSELVGHTYTAAAVEIIDAFL